MIRVWQCRDSINRKHDTRIYVTGVYTDGCVCTSTDNITSFASAIIQQFFFVVVSLTTQFIESTDTLLILRYFPRDAVTSLFSDIIFRDNIVFGRIYIGIQIRSCEKNRSKKKGESKLVRQ